MPFIETPDTWRVAIEFTNSQGNKAYNIIHVNDSVGPFSLTRASELADIIENWGSTVWDTLAVTEWAMTNLHVRDLNTEFGTEFDRDLNIPGAVVGDALPSTVTIAISLRTGLAGRSFRGRLYHVGLGDTTFNGDLIDLGQRTLLINGYETLRSDLIADDFAWSVVSYYADGVQRTGGLVTPISFITITDLVADQQRRRKPKF